MYSFGIVASEMLCGGEYFKGGMKGGLLNFLSEVKNGARPHIPPTTDERLKLLIQEVRYVPFLFALAVSSPIVKEDQVFFF